MVEVTKAVAQKVIETVDAGLVSGVGKPEPGRMCVEAAVCYAMGLPHGDNPSCVAPALRQLKIMLNDSFWSSDAARAKGLRTLAVLQLGSESMNELEFVRRLVPLAKVMAKRAAANAANAASYAANAASYAAAAHAAANAANAASYADDAAANAANAASYAANAASYAADAAASDAELTFFADEVVRILIGMNVPGVQWLYLLDAAHA